MRLLLMLYFYKNGTDFNNKNYLKIYTKIKHFGNQALLSLVIDR